MASEKRPLDGKAEGASEHQNVRRKLFVLEVRS
jgi:hypothetical protein